MKKIYLARGLGPCAITESQMFSHPALPIKSICYPMTNVETKLLQILTREAVRCCIVGPDGFFPAPLAQSVRGFINGFSKKRLAGPFRS